VHIYIRACLALGFRVDRKAEYLPEDNLGSPVAPTIVTTSRRAWMLGTPIGLHKILFYFGAYVHESMIFFANTTFVWAPHFPPSSHTLLRNVLFPLDISLLQYIPYNIVNDNIV